MKPKVCFRPHHLRTLSKKEKGKIMTKPVISIIMGSKSDWATM
ncbi:TPA_asm: 5-(carboxyamino)imidazole ribonucleotide mutase, partial [Listeria monocytogenes]|nr:5-(carboxyamino)imidazole ribonucleotide mutase [Listeria monocytogenes]